MSNIEWSVKHAKSLHQKFLRDLLVALVGDPLKSKVLEKTHKLLKHATEAK